jgi:hypothetical protein
MKDRNIPLLADNFRITGDVKGYAAVTTGHINESYSILTGSDHPGYFLQRINSYIFKNVDQLMNNIELVTRHLASKLDPERHNGWRVLELVEANDGKPYFLDIDGEYWRMFRYIPDTHIFNIVENTKIAYEGGKAFGRFLHELSDLPSGELVETIPDFHNLEKRLLTFDESVKKDLFNRVIIVKEEINFILERTDSMLTIPQLIRQGRIPVRITHNDTKFNNILFDKNDHAVCIVDLDTVMPGSLLFDFGDAIRTGANTVCEDERDLDRVDINLSIFRAYSGGFINSLQTSLTSDEISNLAFSARFMTFIIGLRFLTDYLDGDLYFRTSYPDHNLDRARVQFRLIQAMEQNADAMEQIITDAVSSCKPIIYL